MHDKGGRAHVRLAALGPLTLTIGGKVVHVGGRVPRRILEVLIAARGFWLSDQTLVELVWGDHGGDWETRIRTLRTTIARLNRALQASGRRRLLRENDGYRLVLEPDELDIAVFEEACARAAQARDAGQVAFAERYARQALDQWRGKPFEEAGSVSFVARRAADLNDQRLDVLQILVEALLDTDRPGEAVKHARELVSAEPGNAGWTELLALALHLSGRHGAIEVCQDHIDHHLRRGTLAAQPVRDLQTRLLNDDASVEWVARSPGEGVTRASGPKTFLLVGAAEGSGGLHAPDADGWRALVASVQRSVGAHHGLVFSTGDLELSAVFEGPLAAVSAARDIAVAARESLPPGLRVAMGVHTGTAFLADQVSPSPPVRYASWLRSAAHAGQVLVSAATRALVSDELPPGLTLRDVGAWQFDGSRPADRVHQLVAEGLAGDFPPLRAGAVGAGRLPRTTTSFVGRERPLAEVTALLAERPLVTLTGEGGIGKTRLAVELGTRASPTSYPHGVRYCDVSLADEDTIDDRIAASLGLAVTPDSDHREAIIESLSETHLLLVLDGCEHQHEVAASLVAEVLAADPAARLLVTSRKPLGVPGEQVHKLETLRVPGPADPDPGAAPAVLLLVDRANAAGAEVSGTDPAVIELAVRLEGLPLAIELAATHLASIPAGRLTERLGESFESFTGPAGQPERLRTLRATFDWSFEMVEPEGRRLLAALSVFRGSWSLEVAEAVAAAVGVDRLQVMGLISDLVNLSIVRAQVPAEGPARYRMLDVIRTYADAQLDERDRAAAADLHADYFLSLAERAAVHRRGPDEPAWVGELAVEFDNLRATHHHLVAHGRFVDALRLVVVLGDELHMRERLEIGRWADALAAHRAVADHPLVVDALGIAATAAMLRGRLGDALALARRSIAASEAIEGAPAPWMAHNVLAMAPLAQGQGADMWGRNIRAMEAISDRTGDPFPRALALWDRMVLAEFTGNVEKATAAATDLLALGDTHDNPSIRSMGLQVCGRLAVMNGAPDEANQFFRQALGAAQAALNTLMINTTVRELTKLATDRGGPRGALAALRPIARNFITSGNLREQGPTALDIIEQLLELDLVQPAARALVRLEQSPLSRTPRCEELFDLAREKSSPAEWEIALQEGSSLQFDQVLAGLVQVIDDLAGAAPDDDIDDTDDDIDIEIDDTDEDTEVPEQEDDQR